MDELDILPSNAFFVAAVFTALWLLQGSGGCKPLASVTIGGAMPEPGELGGSLGSRRLVDAPAP